MTPLRVGIAGCGLIAGGPVREGRPIKGNHAAACRAEPRVKLVAVADPSEERRTAFATHWDVADTYADGEEMIARGSLDLLIVATPPDAHERLCIAGATAGLRGILCEKPFSGESRAARRIAEACRRSGTKLTVNFSRRWDDAHRALAKRIAAGDIGEPRVLSGLYTGTLRGNGSHLVDLVRFLAPADYQVESARGPIVAGEGAVSTTLSSRGGVRAHLEPVREARYFVFELDVVGTAGRARLTSGGNEIVVSTPEPSVEFPGYVYLTRHESLARGNLSLSFERALGALVAAVSGEGTIDYTAEEATESLALLDSIAERAARQES